MKKLTLILGMLMIVGGTAFAHDGKGCCKKGAKCSKEAKCCKDKKHCSKDCKKDQKEKEEGAKS